MLLKRDIIILYHLFFLFLSIFIMVLSCSTVPSEISVCETGNRETVDERVEPAPDVTMLHRPECTVDTSIIMQTTEILPHLQPPESISLPAEHDGMFQYPAENMELLTPEPVLKQEEQNNEIPAGNENENQIKSTGEEPVSVENISGLEEKAEKSKTKEQEKEIKKEYKKESEDKTKKEIKKEEKEVKKEKKQVTPINKEKMVQSFKEEQTPHISEIYTHIGENIEISFNNNGWIFTGYIKDEDAKGVKYLSKDATYRESLFTFKSIKTGSYDLEFILQDHTSGSQQTEIVRVQVVDDTEFVPENSADFITSNNLAEDFYNQGEYQHALEEYLKIYDETSPLLNQKIAELYEKLGQKDAAVSYWEINAKREDDYSLPAAEKLLSHSLDTGNTEKIVRYLNYLLGSGKKVPESEILRIVNLLQDKQDYNEAASVLDNYLSLYSNSETRDALYFLLAGLYEKNSGMRDLKQAKYYYERIISEFPAGNYVQPARKRLQYLNRHFFHIQ
ncbi:MAG: hypothetical protein JXB88_11585 [Spirochaetales bacterium]|nr:hypothetical protein [Spirochaetales bacterium]